MSSAGNRSNRKIAALYRRLPKLECKGLCAESCGVVPLYPAEARRIAIATGKKVDHDETLTCKLLENGRCTIYEHRPLLCRLFGMVKKMRCPHGCVPERWLSDQEAWKMMERLEGLL